MSLRAEEWASGTFLGGLSAVARGELLAVAARRAFGPGRQLIREGAAAAHVVLLLGGFAKITTVLEGFETLLGLRLPGEVIGETGALTGQPRNATVTACGRVVAGVVSRADFEAFLRRRPEAATLVMASVARQLNWADRRRADFAVFPAHIRLARLLSEIADVCAVARPDGAVDLAVPLSQPELAAMIGIAPATMHKAVADLRARNLISTGYRRVSVLDPAALRTLAAGRTD
ncbi:Crp/Fnr family transcriptional regulator [Actinoplanes sp. N902-109]|uniref:Crp/Fnr family transcriptional regulator n=1 Tax=Actinoplanes sp. (strain N902-109) TaxID=649831 RepID=UPI00032964C9|nr:Crp/Fnr family transcriptional regulator [Actinoplanes sp. N902-109]AGL18881.1 transcriptional regulator [Actinoplanes sp. N902-109]